MRAGTPVGRIAQFVLEWAEKALKEEEFSRGDYSYSVELVVTLLGRRVAKFIIRRVFKVTLS